MIQKLYLFMKQRLWEQVSEAIWRQILGEILLYINLTTKINKTLA